MIKTDQPKLPHRTLNQIESQFLPTCTEKDCTISIDPISAETNITFSERVWPITFSWFENTPSLNNKIQKLLAMASVMQPFGQLDTTNKLELVKINMKQLK